MATRPAVSRSRAPAGSRGGFVLAPIFVAGAAAVGWLATFEPVYAVVVVVVAGLLLLVAANVTALPIFLVVTMFFEALALGSGLTIGRLAGGLALAILAYYVLAHGKTDLRPNALLAVVGAYGFWSLASVYWASDSGYVYGTTLSYALALAYMLSFAVLVRSTAQLGAIFATLAIGSLVFGLIAFATYIGSSGSVRAAGLQGDPNYFATYQAIALPAALALAASAARPHRRLGYYAVIGVIVLSVASTLSRTGLVALSVVLAATFLVPWRVFFQRARQKLAYAVALGAAALVAVLVGSTAFIERAQTILDPSSVSGDRGSGRTDLWRAALHGFRDDPWLGIGAGNFQGKSLDLLQTTPGVDTSTHYVRAARFVHNAYLETLVELGVVGLALFVFVLALAAWYLFRSFGRARAAGDPTLERFSLALLVSLVGFSVSAVFLSNQLSRVLWILVGLALAVDVVTRRAAAASAAKPGRLAAPVRTARWASLAAPHAAREARPRAELSAGADYDSDVRERFLFQRERRISEQIKALGEERRRIAREQAALAERERDFQAKARRLAEGEKERADLTAQLDERAAAVVEREQRIAALENSVTQAALQLQKQVAALAEHEERLERLDAERASREDEIRLTRLSLEAEARRVAQLEELHTTGASEATETAAALAERERELSLLEGQLARARHELEERSRLLAESERKHAGETAELETRAAQVTAREETVARLQASVGEREGRIAELEREARERIDELASQLAQREQAVARSEADLTTRRHELESQQADVGERMAALEEAERRAAARTNELDGRAADLAQREQKLARAEAATAEARQRLGDERRRSQEANRAGTAERERELEQRARELAAAQGAHADRQAQIENTTAMLREREKRAAAREQELEERADAVAARGRELEQAERERLAQAEERASALTTREEVLAARERQIEEGTRALEARAASLERAEGERAATVSEAERQAASRQEALVRREQELEARSRALEARAATLADTERERATRLAEAEERARALTKREQALAAREREIEEGTRALERRARALDEQAAAISQREEAAARLELEQAARERELVGERAPAAVHGEMPAAPEPSLPVDVAPPEPEPVAELPPVLEPASKATSLGRPGHGEWSVEGLARLVEDHATEFPDRVEEWRSYVYYLRDFAGPDGVLPSSFDWLVQDTFDVLIERALAAR